MIVNAKVAPSHSLLFIAGAPDDFETPEISREGLVWSTGSCIAVGTLMEFDGETLVVLSNEMAEDPADPLLRKVFGGAIDTPKKEVWVSTVDLDGILSLSVATVRSNIEIWANDRNEPDELLILVRT